VSCVGECPVQRDIKHKLFWSIWTVRCRSGSCRVHLCFPSCHVQHTASRCNYDCAGLPYRNCSCTMEFYKAMPCKPKMAIFFQVYLSFACRCSWLASASVRILSHIQVRHLFQFATNSCWLILVQFGFCVFVNGLNCRQIFISFLRTHVISALLFYPVLGTC
jgi:hypothetical protein